MIIGSVSPLVSPARTYAQDFIWARQIDGMRFNQNYDVDVDALGNVTRIGQLNTIPPGADHDPGPGTLILLP